MTLKIFLLFKTNKLTKYFHKFKLKKKRKQMKKDFHKTRM